MKPLTLTLAEFIASLQYEQIPGEAVERVKQCLLDALGCAIYGATAKWCGITNEFVKSQGGIGEACLWRNDFKGPASNVVLGNGSMIHGCDFDDYHVTKIHPGAVVIPAALAVAEKEHLDGKKLITAVVAGYETMIHISHGLNPGASRSKGWHLTGTCGPYGAAAAGGYLMGLSPEMIAHALGMAGTQSSGLWAFTADGSFSKRFHPGRAAQSGLISVELAKRGYKGPTWILEAEDGGFFRATSENFDYGRVTDGLGSRFDTEDVIIKPYPACGSIHSSIDATLAILNENAVDPRRVEKVHVHNSDLVNLQCGFDYKPLGMLQAQMNMKYCIARTLLDGELTIRQFTEKKRHDSKVMDLSERVFFIPDERINALYPRRFPSEVALFMVDGQTYRAKVEMPKGSRENPMSWQEVKDKFRSLTSHLLNERQSRALVALCEGLEGIKDVSEVPCVMGKGDAGGGSECSGVRS